MKRKSIFYILITIILVIVILVIFKQGVILEERTGIFIDKVIGSKIFSDLSFHNILLNLNFSGSLALLLLQILLILVIARILGWLMSKIGQPTVIGEIIAGIILGPSLLGKVAPEFSAFLFPEESLNGLNYLSQLGLILFMFIVGMELDFKSVKKQLKNAFIVSNSSIILPFLMGIIIAYYIYLDYSNGSSFSSFALFLGIAMSITAFPILARIVMERNLSKKPIGSMALAIAAANDVTAWFLMAFVIAIVKAGNITLAFHTILLTIVFVFFMLFVVRKFLNILSKYYFSREMISKAVIALIFAILIFSAWASEVIGIHALFGAFIAGVSVPASSRFRYLLSQKIEDISLVLLLPIFFVITGLRTEISVFNQPHLWGIFGIILAAAVMGKFLGASLSARWVGINWKDSLTLGTLMNTRGLMELIVLNIGYDLGILSTTIFSVLVLVAITTTFMTGPGLDLIDFIFNRKKQKTLDKINESTFNILISFGDPASGNRLLQLGYQLFGNNTSKEVQFTAMHFTPSTDITIQDADTFEKEAFKKMLKIAKNYNININTYYKTTNDISKEITQYANTHHFDLILAGSSRPLFSSNPTGGKVRDIFNNVKTTTGILIDRGFKFIENIMVIIDESNTPLVILKNSSLINNYNIKITIIDINNLIENSKLTEFQNKSNINILSKDSIITINNNFLSNYDLIITTIEYWNKAKRLNEAWINYSPSILILN